MTDIAETQVAALRRANPRAGYWRFWGTTLWGAAIFAAWLVCGVAAAFVTLLKLNPPTDFTKEELRAFIFSHDQILLAAAAASTVGAFAILLLAIRLSRLTLRDYLGMIVPRRRDLTIGCAGLVLLYAPLALVDHFLAPLPSRTYMVNLYHGAAASGHLPLLAAAIIVLAPVSEEVFFRGFLLPGWAVSRIRPAGAIVVTAAIWAALHEHYDLFTIAVIFVLGLFLGWLRYQSGSTLATIILHAIWNAAALAVIAISYPP